VKLADRELLELNQLCGAVIDGTLTDSDRVRLMQWLRDSEAVRRHYVRMLGQSASLSAYAAEMMAEAPDRPKRSARVIPFFAWSAAALAVAASLVGMFRWTHSAAVSTSPAMKRADDVVATITAVKDVQWGNDGMELEPGALLRRGQHLDLRAGFAELTFDSGARVVLEGQTSLDVSSAWDAVLRHGALKASVPPEAIGFRISNPAVDVVDLGTEFTMIADGNGAADVLVLKGEVEASPSGTGDDQTVLLREKDARRFDASGVSEVADSERKFSRFKQPLTLDRFRPKLSYVHWAFDENDGNEAKADVAGFGVNSADAAVKIFEATNLAAAHGAGARGRALEFDGKLFAKARVDGISGDAPRTIAFWVRIPTDAQPTDTWMIAWSTRVRKLANRPVQISWNRRPAEGALGALRTDFGGGYAIGTTSLRDGKWHHVTVYFAPGNDSAPAPQVKQYVDGRLESSMIVPGAVRAPASNGSMAVADTVWLGYRLTGKPEGQRFRGDIDELFIVDRGLEPSEIVALMRDNSPGTAMVATNP
jgi:ferric-dicitrate binding protein FerR (iron transport regulator)